MKIVSKTFTKGKEKNKTYYAPIGSLKDYIKFFGAPLVLKMVTSKFNQEFRRCDTLQKAEAQIKYIKEGRRREYGTSQIYMELRKALKAGNKTLAQSLFAKLIRKQN